jgi:hypothetical protein
VKIKLNSIWVFLGVGGPVIRHMVIDLCDGWVTTWSESCDEEGVAGYSFYGPAEMFVKQFKQLE